jgi:hypothetical protein
LSQDSVPFFTNLVVSEEGIDLRRDKGSTVQSSHLSVRTLRGL